MAYHTYNQNLPNTIMGDNGEFINVPYNPKNKLISIEDVNNIFNKCNFNIQDHNTMNIQQVMNLMIEQNRRLLEELKNNGLLSKKVDNSSLKSFQKKVYVKEEIQEFLLEKKVNYQIENTEHFQNALTHKSYVKQDGLMAVIHDKIGNSIDKSIVPLQDNSYERMEFLGDTVIKLIFADYLYHRYPGEQEGFLTKLKTRLEDKTQLSRIAKIMKLDEFILISAQIEKTIGRYSINILEDSFEGFIGALYLSCGRNVEPCRNILIKIAEQEIDIAHLIYWDTNYKDQLLQYYHKMKWHHPEFVDICYKGPQHNRIYTVGVREGFEIPEEVKETKNLHERRKKEKKLSESAKIISRGTHKNKTKAQQMAAKRALIYYGQLNKDFY